jgi:aerobic C4-dicarboxylate transport protein
MVNGPAVRKRCRFPLYVQVVLAIACGVLIGAYMPNIATSPWIESLGSGFVKLIKMVIAPIIFCTVVSGIAHVQDAARVGRVAVKAIVYFEIVSTFALGMGLLVANVAQPGEGFDGKPDPNATDRFTKEHPDNRSPHEFLLNIIPETLLGALTGGNILQVLFVAVLFGFALMAQGERGLAIRNLIEDMSHVMFSIIAIIMKVAPIGAFGAMAYTVGKYGVGTLGNLCFLVVIFYATAILFIVVVLGLVASTARVSILRLLFYIRAELLLVLATSSSESALPTLMEKLEFLGCSKSVVGLVVPLGYSLNLDGTNIYLTLATLFVSQAMGVSLSLGEQIKILVVAMLTSKGATGVTGAGFITLASTLSAVRPELVPGISIVFGVDKFMSECRSLTNLIGNSVAAVIIARSEGELDESRMASVLAGDFKGDHDNSEASSSEP